MQLFTIAIVINPVKQLYFHSFLKLQPAIFFLTNYFVFFCYFLLLLHNILCLIKFTFISLLAFFLRFLFLIKSSCNLEYIFFIPKFVNKFYCFFNRLDYYTKMFYHHFYSTSLLPIC